MGVKEDVMDLLRSGAVVEAAERAAANPRAFRFVARRLWDESEEVARCSARVLAEASRLAPERGREMIRRFLWALNDESGTNGGPVLAALEEMAERTPEIVEPYIGSLLPMLEDEGLRDGIVHVFERFIHAMPSAREELCADILAATKGLNLDVAEGVRQRLCAEVK